MFRYLQMLVYKMTFALNYAESLHDDFAFICWIGASLYFMSQQNRSALVFARIYNNSQPEVKNSILNIHRNLSGECEI